MTTLEAQSSMFPTAVEAPSIVHPGVRFELDRRGNRVTGSIHLDAPNPMNRSNCRVSVIRRVNWTDDQEAIAFRVAGHWFRDIGHLALLRNHQLCHIVSRLREGHSEDWMHAAVDEYAKSAWHRDNKAWKPLGDFFRSETFDKWLDQCSVFKDHQQKVAAERVRKAREKEAEDTEAKTTGLHPIADLPDHMLRLYFKHAESDARAVATAETDGMQRAFSEMHPREQNRLLERVAMEKCDTKDWRKARDILAGSSGDTSYFYFDVYRRAADAKCRRDGLAPEEITIEPKPTQPYIGMHDDLRADVERRVMIDAAWARPEHSRGLSQLSYDLLAAVREVRLQHWLADKPYDPVANNEPRVREHINADRAARAAKRAVPKTDRHAAADTLSRIRDHLTRLRSNGHA